MDDFFTKEFCDRCRKSLKNGRIMSMLNEECICLGCKDKEKCDSQYDMSVETDVSEIVNGNLNFPGIQKK